MIGDWILVSCLAVMLGYALVVLLAVFRRRRRIRLIKFQEDAKVSILVPFRNEVLGLSSLADSFQRLDTATLNVEFVLINDHSDDGSLGVIQKYAESDQRFRVLNLPEGHAGKKAAIEYGLKGIDSASIVVAADADSVYPEKWLITMLSSMQTNNSDLICAPLSFGSGGGILGSFQRIENLGITAVNAAFQRLGWTVSCSGANMAYKRKVHPGTFDGRSPSGDDMELLVNARQSNHKIGWEFDINTIARTSRTNKLSDLISQRLRWGSKNSLYADYQVVVPGLLIVFTNIVVLLSLVLMWFNPMFAVIPFAKLVLDAAILLRFSFIDGIRQDIVYFPLIQLIYPIYIIFIACLSPFAQVSWKGRSIKGDG